MFKKWLKFLGPLLMVVVLGIALAVIHDILKHYHYRDIVRSLKQLPRVHLIFALALTALSYLTLTLYDTIGVRTIGHPLPYRRIALVSFIGYAVNNNTGFAGVAGNSIRYRIYTSWGLSAIEVAKVIGFCVITFWLGFLTMAGVSFIIDPMPSPAGLPLKIGSLRILGIIFLIPVVFYLIGNTIHHHRPFRFRKWTLQLPPPHISLAQIAIAGLDWSIAAGVFYMLLPAGSHISYPQTIGLFLLAQIAGLVSHVPGGLGVFELVMIYSLSDTFGRPEIVGILLAYRGIYYLLPLGLAVILLGTHELVLRAEKFRKTAHMIGQWAPGLIPNSFAFATFIAGAILLFSGSTPGVSHRLTLVKSYLPAGLIDAAHLIASMVGAALLLLARGLQRKLDSAYLLTVVLLTTGISASLMKGWDYEEASVLLLILLAFIPCRPHFHRKASLLSRYSLSPGWVAAIALTIAGSIWLGFFSYKHVRYTPGLWTRLNVRADASKFLRASVGAIGVVALYGIKVLLRPAPPEQAEMSEEDWRTAREIVAKSPKTYPWAALLRDKRILFNEQRNAFIMYGVEGRSWVALGDPVGPEDEYEELTWHFRELSDAHGGWTVFYHVTPERLPLYLDLGLVLLKLGEEALVPLEHFSVEGKKHKTLRQSHHKIEREGHRFEILAPETVEEALPRLRLISDDWLRAKNTREKGFSLGFFSETYLKETPLAVVRDAAGSIVAFANIWPGADKEELSIDMMRYMPELQTGIMDYLFVELMLYGKQEGYRWFNLGMAPLSGLENRALAPLWMRIGAMIFRHGEHFYNFRGLRQYKEKFDPVWTPKYLASPGGIALPRVLTNIAALISRGLRGVVTK